MRKAVFTYWNPKGDAAGYRNHDELAATLALSLEYAKKNYICELVTDQAGYELLVEKHKLEFDMNAILLNKLNGKIPVELWAYAKIYACSLQKEPFVHIDNDFVLWDKLPKKIESAPYFFQSLDYVHREAQYKLMLEMEGDMVPEIIRKNPSPVSWNFGIMGFKDISQIQAWHNAAYEFINKISKNANPQRQFASINMFIEQYFLACFIHRQKAKVQSLATNLDKIDKPGIAFTHLWGQCKQDAAIMDRIKLRLLKEFPTVYHNIFTTDKTPA